MDLSPLVQEPKHVVGVCGSAVAGSEAARKLAEHGFLVVVFEQNARPYGKIEDGLPRWHEKLREQEYAKIDENLDHPNILFVPQTRLGADFSFTQMSSGLGFNALVLAHGAWRDRALPVSGVEAFVGRGLVYQNSFVYWFNHYHEAGYVGATYDISDGAIVIGGGLASIDVVKIINLELYHRALAARGIDVELVEMEVKGIPTTLEKHGIAASDLGIRGCTLFYRRRKQDMPLATMDNPTPEQERKLEVARAKVMEKVQRKYLINFEECLAPIAPIIEGERLTGLVFRRNEMRDGRLEAVAGSDREVRASLIVSSIGSIPVPIDGVPMKGELYQWEDWNTGRLTEGVFGLGNVLTGKGNIKASRENVGEIIGGVIGHVEKQPRLSRAELEQVLARVKERWSATNYPGSYRPWIERVHPAHS